MGVHDDVRCNRAKGRLCPREWDGHVCRHLEIHTEVGGCSQGGWCNNTREKDMTVKCVPTDIDRRPEVEVSHGNV